MKRPAESALLVVLLLLLSGCSQSGEVNTVLADAIKNGRIVMVELDSVDCTPCEQMKPVLQELRDTYKGKLDVLLIDVRNDRPSALRFGVTVIPTQIFLDRRGKEFHRHNGFYDFDKIVPVLYNAGLPKETNPPK